MKALFHPLPLTSRLVPNLSVASTSLTATSTPAPRNECCYTPLSPFKRMWYFPTLKLILALRTLLLQHTSQPRTVAVFIFFPLGFQGILPTGNVCSRKGCCHTVGSSGELCSKTKTNCRRIQVIVDPFCKTTGNNLFGLSLSHTTCIAIGLWASMKSMAVRRKRYSTMIGVHYMIA